MWQGGIWQGNMADLVDVVDAAGDIYVALAGLACTCTGDGEYCAIANDNNAHAQRCDDDDDCEGDLKCGTNNCAWSSSDNCCTSS